MLRVLVRDERTFIRPNLQNSDYCVASSMHTLLQTVTYDDSIGHEQDLEPPDLSAEAKNDTSVRGSSSFR